MKTTIKLVMIIMIMQTVVTSCKKEEEYQPKGNYVTTGTNVNTIQTYPFSTTSWQGGGASWFCSHQDFSMNLNGSVEVYQFDASLNGWLHVPRVQSNVSMFYEVFPDVHSVWIYFENVDGVTNIANPGLQSFKIITIPPSIRIKNPNVNWNNYSEVQSTFHLAD